MAQQRRRQGHPAKQDPEINKVFKTMRSSVELVADVGPRLSEESEVKLRAATLGLMFVYAELTGMPAPDAVVGEVFETVVNSVG